MWVGFGLGVFPASQTIVSNRRKVKPHKIFVRRGDDLYAARASTFELHIFALAGQLKQRLRSDSCRDASAFCVVVQALTYGILRPRLPRYA